MNENEYFKKFEFTKEQILGYLNKARGDLEIAGESKRTEVKFQFSYNALIKAGIALIAVLKKEKVRSVPGHHVKILEVMSKLLGDDLVYQVGNAMRTKRNLDLYEGKSVVTEKEAGDYYEFTGKILKKIDILLKDRLKKNIIL